MQTQREFIHAFNNKHRPKFNEALFKRSDDDLIRAIKYIIYSCERDSTFKIKVLSFDVIDNYDDINHILWEYEDYIINKGKSSSSKEESTTTSTSTKKKTKQTNSKSINQFAYIDLKDSDLKLIKVTYYIAINEKKNGWVEDTITVYIAIPRIIDGFYYRLNGNMYSAMYQIVDASTYNNSASKNAKKQSITFKSIPMATRIYRYTNKIPELNQGSTPITYFVANIFNKSILVIKYFLAKFGYYDTMRFLYIEDVLILTDISKVDQENNYIFMTKTDMYIVCPKFLFDRNQICQSFVYTMYILINTYQVTGLNNVFGSRAYIESLGSDFMSKNMSITYDKGLSILSSLTFIYDKITMSDLRLDMEDKADMFRVLRWMIYEFNALRSKDNLDITTKRVRCDEYIASYYATRLVTGIYRISDKAERADINTIRTALQTPPMYLIKTITNTKCQLVNYKNCVNDLDSLIALKYTYKGVAGIGAQSNAISSEYRSIHPSHLGRVDIDSSSNSDPGTSGTLCPLTVLYNTHFSEYKEPSEWMSKVNAMLDQYRAISSRKTLYNLVNTDKPTDPYVDSILDDCAIAACNIMRLPLQVLNNMETDDNSSIDLLGDGSFILE